VAVTVDHEPLAVKDLGLETVGQVFSHLQKDNRLVVQVLIDGEEPAPGELGRARQTILDGHTVFIETADPRALALEVLAEVTAQIEQSETFKAEAADLLQKNQSNRAMEKLSTCLRVWQNAGQSIEKTGELLRIDLSAVSVNDQPLAQLMGQVSEQLRQIKTALEQRDFVSLSDVLLYEMTDTSSQWLAAIAAMRDLISSLR
jgi:hypothetical protein